MASIFSKNGILLNRLDYYCLICDVKFLTEDAALAHILDAIHKEALKKCGYLEKYKNHFIRKTNGLYFCEPCNLTYPTATKVELHIDEECHIDERNKINPFQRVKDQVIAFNRFVISNEAWNGCIKDTCFLCNTEFEDAAAHWDIKTHMLKLIKSEVIFDGSNHTVYRTIDEKSKQCLTCNVIIENDLATHYATAEHKEAYKLHDESCENLTVIQNGNENTDKKNGVAVVSENVNSDINKKADKSANKDVKKDFKKDAKHDSDKESSRLHEKVKVTQTPQKSVKKENAEELDKIYCKNLGAKNYITGEYGERWCILCGWLLEEFNIGDHIRSKHHQYLLKLHNERITENTNNTSSEKEESMPYEYVERYQKSNVNINLVNETAFCKQCSKNVDFNTSAIDKHIEEHKKTSKKKSPETLSSGIKSNGTDGTTLYTRPVLLDKQKRSQKTESVGDFAKKHGFSHNVADRSYYCRPCCRRLNNNLDDLQKHVASKTHMENTKQPAKTDANEVPVKEPISKYIKSFEMIDNMNECIIIINNKIWLNAYGFFLIARNDGRIFCHGCHIDLTPQNVMQHIIVTDYHRGMIENCLLITSLENEFIREIKLDVYHCGYCNSTENDWYDILDHIKMAEHKREKEKAERSLRQHRPNFNQGTQLREIDDMLKQFVRLNN